DRHFHSSHLCVAQNSRPKRVGINGRLVLLGQHEGQDASGFAGVGGILRPELHTHIVTHIVIVYFPKERNCPGSLVRLMRPEVHRSAGLAGWSTFAVYPSPASSLSRSTTGSR